MDKARSESEDEIDLADLIYQLWEGKWIITLLIFISVTCSVVFQLISPLSYRAITEIRPILSSEGDLYKESNSLGILEITPTLLLALYIEQLESKVLFREAIQRYGLITRNEFETEDDYIFAVSQLANGIILAEPDVSSKTKPKKYWTIEFAPTDRGKWMEALEFVHAAASETLRQILQNRFNTALSIEKTKREFGIEDVTTEIDNALTDYDRATSDRLYYLREQAEIARKLNISKNTIEAQTFNAQSGVLANIKTDNPFYLRGYEAIEKEIELLESRDRKEAFVVNLLSLEQKKRAIEQDKLIERAISLFTLTPINDPTEFKAVTAPIQSTQYTSKRLLILVLGAVFGGVMGVFYVLIAKNLGSRRKLAEQA